MGSHGTNLPPLLTSTIPRLTFHGRPWFRIHPFSTVSNKEFCTVFCLSALRAGIKPFGGASSVTSLSSDPLLQTPGPLLSLLFGHLCLHGFSQLCKYFSSHLEMLFWPDPSALHADLNYFFPSKPPPSFPAWAEHLLLLTICSFCLFQRQALGHGPPNTSPCAGSKTATETALKTPASAQSRSRCW